MAKNPAQIGNHVQVHALQRESNGVAQWPEFTGSHQILSANPAKCFQSRGELEAGITWWQVAVHAAEVWRQTQVGDNVIPLTQAEILNAAKAPVKAGLVTVGPVSQLTANPLFSGRYSALKARVTFTDQTAIQRVVELDIGGGSTLSFCGSHVGVDVLFPEPSVVVPPGATAQQILGLPRITIPGLILDSWIQASAAPSPCAPIGREAARYTLTRIVNLGEIMLFEVPPGAVSAQVYVDPVLDAAANLYQWVAGPLPSARFAVGDIPAPHVFSGGGALPVPGNARWLSVTNGGLGRQEISVVFELEY